MEPFIIVELSGSAQGEATMTSESLSGGEDDPSGGGKVPSEQPPEESSLSAEPSDDPGEDPGKWMPHDGPDDEEDQ